MTDPEQQEQDEETITAHVVAVLDNRELLLDVGKVNSSVALGMRFVVLGKVEIATPDARTVQVDYPKTIVKIVRFQGEDLSVGRTFRTVAGRKGTEPFDIKQIVQSPILRGTPDIPPRPETINTGDQDTALRHKDTVVRPGDVARLTVGDEFLDTL